jgi:hypothetical protein
MEKVDIIMEELKTTYDTNLLDNTSEKYQEEYLNFCIMNRNTGNKVIKELVYNHYTKYKPTADFIGGPKTISIHWHPKYKKIIYIFGEWHSNTMDCKKFKTTETPYPITVPIEDYLYDLMKSTDVFLDIYFEFPFRVKELFSSDDYRILPVDRGYSNNYRLDNLLNKFKKCLLYDSRHAKSCRLARSHYFDIRHTSSNPLDLEESKIDILWVMSVLGRIRNQFGILGLKRTIDKLIEFLQSKPIITHILRNLADKNNEKVITFMKNQLLENRYIKKQLSKIVENRLNLIYAIDSFFYREIRLAMIKPDNKFVRKIDKIKRYANTLLNYQTQSDYELYDNLRGLTIFMIEPLSFFADAYLLARVFKDFDMTKMAYKGAATHQPKRAHNIIIYAGDAHAHNYRNFLSYVGFTEIDSSGINLQNPYPYPSSTISSMPEFCLDMRSINQPFFSYKRYDQSSFDVIKKSNRPPASIPYDDKKVDDDSKLITYDLIKKSNISPVIPYENKKIFEDNELITYDVIKKSRRPPASIPYDDKKVVKDRQVITYYL